MQVIDMTWEHENEFTMINHKSNSLITLLIGFVHPSVYVMEMVYGMKTDTFLEWLSKIIVHN